ncbi:uncharacterized protein LOC113651467 [Tachysurus fulvidraco]|uniref:uncharacterized protein LOC113651467 n=1 Tax=Tachysurus fulvidraco TaxID=1234273 RepID=UPI001FF0790F|nr:uncharacterized protein LOC113651467 [Tachysurus fulvidraco]
MNKFLSMLILQMLFVFFTPCLLEIVQIDTVSVDPGEIITLHCNISIKTNYTQILWYQLGSEEVKRLISAEQGKLDKKFIPTYNVNESHYDITERCSLVITDIRQTDLGFYYCECKKDKTHIQFGKPIRLSFTDDHKTDQSDTQESALPAHCGLITIILSCVCAVSVSVTVICSSLYCSKLQEGFSTWDSNNKEAELEASDLTSVTYTSVS